MASSSAALGRSVTGAEVAKVYLSELKAGTSSATKTLGRPPSLVGFLASDDRPSAAYAEWTQKACSDIGVRFELRRLDLDGDLLGIDSGAGVGEIEEKILEANMDDEIDGIMIYYPLFASQSQQDQYLQQVVSPLKDVEGLNFSYLFNLYHNCRLLDPRLLALAHFATPALSRLARVPSPVGKAEEVKSILPCTPLAIIKTLEYCQVYNSILPYGQRAYGKTITIINRSEVVGRPLAALLSNDGARVFSADINGILEFTRRTVSATGSVTLPRHRVNLCKLDLKDCLAISDVVVSGVPSESYKIKTAHLKDGVVAINFSSSKNFEDDIKEKASLYMPALGKVTIAMLQRNLLRLISYKQAAAESTTHDSAQTVPISA